MGLSKIVFKTTSGGSIQLKSNAGNNVDFTSTGFTVKPVVRLGDLSNHGGHMSTATAPMKADGLAVCKDGDSHVCPITGHGTTAVTGTTNVLKTGGSPILRTGDKAGCGAVIIQGSPTLQSS